MTPLIPAHYFTFLTLEKHDESPRDSRGESRAVKANPKAGGDLLLNGAGPVPATLIPHHTFQWHLLCAWITDRDSQRQTSM